MRCLYSTSTFHHFTEPQNLRICAACSRGIKAVVIRGIGKDIRREKC